MFFGGAYVCVCVFVFGFGVHLSVYICMCLRSSAKVLKPTKMFCCAVQPRQLIHCIQVNAFVQGTIFAVPLLLCLHRVTLKSYVFGLKDLLLCVWRSCVSIFSLQISY